MPCSTRVEEGGPLTGKLQKDGSCHPLTRSLTMSATHVHDFTPTATPKLYLAFELGWTSWNLAFTTAIAQKPRLRTIAPRPRWPPTRDPPRQGTLQSSRRYPGRLVLRGWSRRLLDPSLCHPCQHRKHRCRCRVNRSQSPCPPRQIRSTRRGKTPIHVDPLSRRRVQTLERGPRAHR